MKKLLAILAICLLPGVAWGASYYGCGAGAINGDTTWCAVGDVSAGVCAKDSGDYVAGATALAAGNTLYANGCTITIPSNTGWTDDKFTATKISTKGDGSKGAGGGFTANANDITVTLDASIEGGTTDCLTASNTAGTASVINILTTAGGGTITTDATTGADGIYITGTKVTVNIGKSGSPVTITGGGATNWAIRDASTVTTKTVYANMTAGTFDTSGAYTITAPSGTVNIIGDITANASTTNTVYRSNSATVNITGSCTGGSVGSYRACLSTASSGTVTITGDCIGGTNGSEGCAGMGGGAVTVIGNIVGSTGSMGAGGNIIWNPTNSTKNIKVTYDGASFNYLGPGLSSDVGGTAITGANTAANVLDSAWFVRKDTGAMTQGTKKAGGAWAQ